MTGAAGALPSESWAPVELHADPANRALGKIVAGNIMSTAARRFRDREAILCVGTGRRFTYRQTNERTNRLAHALLGLGLRKPDASDSSVTIAPSSWKSTSPWRSSVLSAFR
jgi:acyl-CoA synthetase (AMP-forming)/AMP-acid ligase II